MKLKKIYLFIVLFLPLSAMGGNLSLTVENDLFGDSDRHYTHGTSLHYLFEETPSKLSFFNDRVSKVGVQLGQHLYTPSDISISELIEDDRPYGGWLYVGASLSIIKENVMDFIEIDLGISGEPSMAEGAQEIIHEFINSKKPMGWDNQLNTEVGVNITYQRKYAWRYDSYLDFDAIGYGGGALGSAFTYLNSGLTLRLGRNLPSDFGVTRMEPTPRAIEKSFYLLCGVEGRFVLRNLFLDGNLFSDSHSVDKENLVGDLYYGFGMNVGTFYVTYIYNIRSKEFKYQDYINKFGTIVFSWVY